MSGRFGRSLNLRAMYSADLSLGLHTAILYIMLLKRKERITGFEANTAVAKFR